MKGVLLAARDRYVEQFLGLVQSYGAHLSVGFGVVEDEHGLAVRVFYDKPLDEKSLEHLTEELSKPFTFSNETYKVDLEYRPIPKLE